MKKKYNHLLLVCFIILNSCQQPVRKEIENKIELPKLKNEILIEEKSVSKSVDKAVLKNVISIDSVASLFIDNLGNGKSLKSFFINDWTLTYHEYNRCEGSTEGKINHLKSFEIDENIILNVKNDGDG